MRWYEHITRSTGLAKMILQGTVQYKEEVGKADRKGDGNGQEKGWLKPLERLRTERNGGKCLPDHP